jgi:Flp pilus assembly protein TadG
MAEAVITTTAFMALIFGMVDLGVGVLRNHMISEAARQGARQAAVHGSSAPAGWNGGPWGSTTFNGNGNSSNPIVTGIQPYLSGLDPTQVTIQVQWLDGGNQAEQRVQVTVSTTWTPLYTTLFGSQAKTLSASSTMPIAH